MPQTDARVLTVACYGSGREMLFDELKQKLRIEHLTPSDGSIDVKVERISSLTSLRARFRQGEVDFFVGSPYLGLILMQDTKCDALSYRPGKASMVCVTGWAPHRKLQDLKGYRLALGETYSPASSLEVLSELLEQKIPTQRLGSVQDPVSEGRIGWVVSGDPETSYFWLMRNRIEAIALDERDFDRLEASAPGTLRSLHREPSSVGELLVGYPDLEPVLQRVVSKTLEKPRFEGDPEVFLEMNDEAHEQLRIAGPRWSAAATGGRRVESSTSRKSKPAPGKNQDGESSGGGL